MAITNIYKPHQTYITVQKEFVHQETRITA